MPEGHPWPIVLVVEDDFEERQVTARLLQDSGYRVVCAANGQEALELLSGLESPGLVILDLAMPIMDGWAFLTKRNEVPKWTAIPVVIVTGDRDAEALTAALGAAAFLSKPMNPADLARVVNKYALPASG